MSTHSVETNLLIRNAVTALERGDREAAQTHLQQVIALEPYNEEAWLWAAKAANTIGERIYCYNEVLKINPYNQTAYETLSILYNTSNDQYAKPANWSILEHLYGDPDKETPHSTTLELNPIIDENNPINQAILRKMKWRVSTERIIRFISSEYSLDWSDATARVNTVWSHHRKSIETQNDIIFAIGAVIGLLFGILFIILTLLNSHHMRDRTTSRMVGTGVLIIICCVLALAEIIVRRFIRPIIISFFRRQVP